jgi:hypothetical protein
MIGKITKGTSFGPLVRYLLKPDKNAEILDTTALVDSPDEIARTFERTCARNPAVQRTVTHVSIAFAREDGPIDRDTKIRVGEKVIEALGYSKSHYLMVAHGRDDPGHHFQHNHDHMHIALTSVDLDGRWVDDAWNFRRLEASLRQIEIEEGLRQVLSSWEAKRSAPTSGQRQRYDREMAEQGASALPVSHRLQACIHQAATASETVAEFAKRLEALGVESRLNITRTGKIRGISYQMEGVTFQGNQLYDASYPKLQSVYGLKLDDRRQLHHGQPASSEVEVNRSILAEAEKRPISKPKAVKARRRGLSC